MFEDEFVVTDLEYRDKEQLRERPDSRNAIFDIFCTLDTGEHIILEMQNNNQKHFEDRALYYASRGIARQGLKGGTWDYDFNAVFGIYFMNFTHAALPQNFRKDYGICRLNQGKDNRNAVQHVLTRKLRMVFLQLPLFTKTEIECKTDLDKWTYILMNMDTLDDIPWRKEKEAFEAIAELGSYEALSEEDRNRYDDAQRNYWDSIAVYEGAKEKGREEGREEGKNEEKQSIAKALKGKGINPQVISEATGLTLEQIEKL